MVLLSSSVICETRSPVPCSSFPPSLKRSVPCVMMVYTSESQRRGFSEERALFFGFRSFWASFRAFLCHPDFIGRSTNCTVAPSSACSLLNAFVIALRGSVLSVSYVLNGLNAGCIGIERCQLLFDKRNVPARNDHEKENFSRQRRILHREERLPAPKTSALPGIVDAIERLEEVIHHSHHILKRFSGAEFLRHPLLILLALLLRHKYLQEDEAAHA